MDSRSLELPSSCRIVVKELWARRRPTFHVERTRSRLGRCLPMTIDQMRNHARLCRSEAEAALNPAVQALLREMAAKWDALADLSEGGVS
jgi:hypothetical protein